MTQKEVADALRWSSAKLMRIEAGKVNVSFTDLQALLKHYGVTDPGEIDVLNDLATSGRGESMISSKYKEALSDGFAEFLEQEESASIIRHFEPNLIPGPLQTREYATAALRALPDQELPDQVVERRVDARMERAALLSRADAPQAFFLMDESALLRNVGAESGSEGLMTAQLEHVKELGSLPNITVQFLPFTIGLYRALRSPFVILEFDDELDDGLVYIESLQDELIIREDVESIVGYIDRFQALEKRATSGAALSLIIDRAVERLRESPSVAAG